jgi:hypothetical protein
VKVLLLTGAPHASHEAIFRLLGSHGLATANPSRYDGRTPEMLHRLMLASHEIDLDKRAPLESLKPGKVWGEMAADLFVANIDQTFWGWPLNETALLAEFWMEFDPQVRFLLCYEAPNVYVANALASTPEPDPQIVEAALAEWTRWNSFLLLLFQRQRDRCMLVNSQAVLRDPSRLIDSIHRQWQWALDGGAVELPSAPPTLSYYLAREFIPADHVAWVLARKLNDHAQDLGGESVTQSVVLKRAWASWAEIRERLAACVNDNSRLNSQLEDMQRTALEFVGLRQAGEESHRALQAENESLKAQVRELRTQAEQVPAPSVDTERLSQQIAKLTARIERESRDNVRAAELVLENEHLMVALHQAQEELAKHRLRDGATGREAGEVDPDMPHNDFADDEARPVALVENFLLDLRRPFEGTNWHDAEIDGRWAGPGMQSSIKLPALVPGSYTLEFGLVDAIALDIVYGLRIEAFGADVPFEFSQAPKHGAFPVTCRAMLDVPPQAGDGPWSLQFKFPRTVTPSDLGSSDRRHLTVRIDTLQLTRGDHP